MSDQVANARRWDAARDRLKRRRDYWQSCKDDAMRIGNLCNAAGFDCRAAGLQDALKILDAIEEEHPNSY